MILGEKGAPGHEFEAFAESSAPTGHIYPAPAPSPAITPTPWVWSSCLDLYPGAAGPDGRARAR